jgi:hypothetical protein
MIVAVSVALGKSADEVMEMTVEQVGLYYSKLKRAEFDYQELQARLVWAIANGWKKPQEVSEADLDKLKDKGILKDTV